MNNVLECQNDHNFLWLKKSYTSPKLQKHSKTNNEKLCNTKRTYKDFILNESFLGTVLVQCTQTYTVQESEWSTYVGDEAE